MSRATQNAQLDPDRPGSIVQCPGSPSRSLRPSGATSATSFSSATQHSARSQPSRESSLLSATPTKRSSLSRHASNAGARSRVGPETPIGSPRRLSDKSKGKRKAEDVDITPRDLKKDAGQHTTFLIPEEGRSLRLSDSSHAPSSYHRKRARLSTSSPSPTPSRPSSAQAQNSGAQPAQRYDSWSSRTSAQRGRTVPPSPRAPSRAASARSSLPPASMATAPSTPRHHRTLSQVRQHERPQSQSFSQVSIPISALVSPHAPSIGARSTRYHMHDPRKPPKKLQDTPWTLARPTEDDPGSPRHAWLFFIGFILFPLWWIAAFLPVPQTRTAGDSSVEKAVTIDDPQIERDAKRWRLRCRIMSVVSAVTYIPFIILVAIFARR
ncbi:hypothetical protein CONPUDRAFT_82144 [Coniophora puteana RWD-64-598 SS2]|uniref:Uncharacterized protein n=1 Tax=Coniophora puteana (strain RWD-64-598) TaxID=741705 RepID=A0A5M3MPU4_CONPW|nr:uncharacterized protein CONPUDRAFT_82144 [Coniophora puteana RWD-64-598 SS2]EIW81076.1 hypothetical protein CONPUDRAFT_82144 [Coniophora puteana RWD-64-598 SS2]